MKCFIFSFISSPLAILFWVLISLMTQSYLKKHKPCPICVNPLLFHSPTSSQQWWGPHFWNLARGGPVLALSTLSTLLLLPRCCAEEEEEGTSKVFPLIVPFCFSLCSWYSWPAGAFSVRSCMSLLAYSSSGLTHSDPPLGPTPRVQPTASCFWGNGKGLKYGYLPGVPWPTRNTRLLARDQWFYNWPLPWPFISSSHSWKDNTPRFSRVAAESREELCFPSFLNSGWNCRLLS